MNVLLLEAGGDDDVASIREAASWPINLGGEHDWNFSAQANPSINGRSLPLSMGKVLGGGSSINLMIWARGHKMGYSPIRCSMVSSQRMVPDSQGLVGKRRGAAGSWPVQRGCHGRPTAGRGDYNSGEAAMKKKRNAIQSIRSERVALQERAWHNGGDIELHLNPGRFDELSKR